MVPGLAALATVRCLPQRGAGSILQSRNLHADLLRRFWRPTDQDIEESADSEQELDHDPALVLAFSGAFRHSAKHMDDVQGGSHDQRGHTVYAESNLNDERVLVLLSALGIHGAVPEVRQNVRVSF